jgi:hypothetical protein
MIDTTCAPIAPAMSRNVQRCARTAHNPDTFFQARETVNPYYDKVLAPCRRRWIARPD